MSHFFFFFNDTATTEIYTLSLHDALPICCHRVDGAVRDSAAHATRSHGRAVCERCRADREFIGVSRGHADATGAGADVDRKSTRLNSSHQIISYAVFCLKKKKQKNMTERE